VHHQHQHAAVPVIMNEADEDILLDAQRPCFVKEEETTASAAVTIGDVARPMTGKGKRKMERCPQGYINSSEHT
jgi:hypothetical protein